MSITKDEQEHMEALLKSPGWALFAQAVRAEWETQFSNYVKKAADDREDATALQKLRQVLAAKEAVTRMLTWPQERLALIERQKEIRTPITTLSRRGPL